MYDTFDDELYEEDEQPAGGGRSRIVTWLVILGLAGLLMPLFLISTTLQEANLTLLAELEELQTELEVTPTPDPEVTELEDTLTALRGEMTELEGVLATLESGALNWPVIMVAIGDYDQSQIALTNLVQNGTRIIVNGHATEESAVVAYTRTLEETGLFNRVLVQSITLQTAKESDVPVAEFALMVEVMADVE